MSTRPQALKVLPSPRLWDMIWAPMRLKVLQTALSAGVFEVLNRKPLTAPELAKAIKADARATRMVGDELVALGMLNKKGGRYALTPESSVFMVKDSPFCITMAGEFAQRLSQSWVNLREVLKSGKPVVAVNDTAVGEEFFEQLVSQIFPTGFASASALSRILRLSSKRDLRILDVAAGSGAWSLPFALENKRARVTASDMPIVLKVTRKFTKKFGVADRYDYLEGDIRTVDFGRNHFDLVILGHICHSEGAEWSRRLIAKSAAALKPGGILAIPDMVPNDARTGPEFPLLFAINMLLHTSEGDTFTISEYRKWMRGAGLEKISQLDSRKMGCDIVIGNKPGLKKRKKQKGKR